MIMETIKLFIYIYIYICLSIYVSSFLLVIKGEGFRYIKILKVAIRFVSALGNIRVR